MENKNIPKRINVAKKVVEVPVVKKVVKKNEIENKALGTCFITGESIFKKKNLNVIQNADRPEFNGKVISTAALNKLIKLTEEAKNVPQPE